MDNADDVYPFFFCVTYFNDGRAPTPSFYLVLGEDAGKARTRLETFLSDGARNVAAEVDDAPRRALVTIDLLSMKELAAKIEDGVLVLDDLAA